MVIDLKSYLDVVIAQTLSMSTVDRRQSLTNHSEEKWF